MLFHYLSISQESVKPFSPSNSPLTLLSPGGDSALMPFMTILGITDCDSISGGKGIGKGVDKKVSNGYVNN
jgi:hypothetical protein